jgi:hypothetical protein
MGQIYPNLPQRHICALLLNISFTCTFETASAYKYYIDQQCTYIVFIMQCQKVQNNFLIV